VGGGGCFKDLLLTVAQHNEMNPIKSVLISTENDKQFLGMKQKYTVLPGIPPTHGEYKSKQLYSPRKHIPLCQAPNAFNI
jgi:hypothetical protein